MATTAQRVFELAIGLMDELSSSGQADTSATAGYKNRTPGILNILCGELLPLSDDNSVTSSGVRPVCAELTALSENVGLDDILARSVLPYGLASHLLADENPQLAAFFQQRYMELKSSRGAAAAQFSAVEDVYGGVEHGEFSRW